MTLDSFILWSLFFVVVGFVLLLVDGLCVAAAKPTPSPLDRVADWSLCDNCVDLDQCEDDQCPYDWVDFGIEVTD